MMSLERLDEQLRDERAELGRDGTSLSLVGVVAAGEGREDRGVGRRAADAVLLERLDERRLGEARRRLREVLLRVERRRSVSVSPSSIGGSCLRVRGLVLGLGVLGRLRARRPPSLRIACGLDPEPRGSRRTSAPRRRRGTGSGRSRSSTSVTSKSAGVICDGDEALPDSL